MSSVHTVTVGMVGAGPKALMALRALDTELAARATATGRRCTVRVDLFDPWQPGSGRVWDPTQPAHLLMNVDPSMVDLRSPHVPHDFRTWEAHHAAAVGQRAGQQFPPRRLVGHYLAWVYECLSRSPHLELHHEPAPVTRIERMGQRWQFTSPAGTTGPYDHVLLTTGHHAHGDSATSFGPQVGPDHRALMDPDGPVAAGSHVTVVGAALTGLDVVRSLTLGRPEAMPARITLVSRGGHLLLPKPVRTEQSVVDCVRARTADLPDYDRDPSMWWDELVTAAGAAAKSQRQSLDPEVARAYLDGLVEPEDMEQQWRMGLAWANGQPTDDARWWLGRAWSAGYSDVVRTLERRPRDHVWWPRWRERAARLERWAFGPPASTIEHMLELLERGQLHLARSVAADAVRVDAFIEPPGAQSPLLRQLIASGLGHVRPEERGIFTLPDAICVDAVGNRLEGLAAVGRPTEDPVIGHDTLSSTLHHDITRWAKRCAWASEREAQELLSTQSSLARQS
jgi:uncharacterized NAD(P)/FAD-binding protein YdhS